LLQANTKMDKVMKHVAELEEKLAKLTKELNEANAIKKEAIDAVEKGDRQLNPAQMVTQNRQNHETILYPLSSFAIFVV